MACLTATCELPNRSDSRSVNQVLLWKFPGDLRHVTVMMLADVTLLFVQGCFFFFFVT